ncbi:uncharacterized protein LOC126891728 isoform X5 [Diabrotica virgifera virgifera]|uniref:Uncharacterized protein n=1 Tax=Diabrotica virgifera virgifera TaxID=50390 RepID=A0ABM5L3F2_DIAVI|nr:uncharacterized protein LOC126891728 isoform X5 [Diabrotica virgifera virgifera]
MVVKGVVLCLWFVFLGITTATLESFPNTTRSTIRKRRQSSLECTLPPQLENGRWLVTEADVKPGDKVDFNSIIRLECHEGYQLYPDIRLQICDSYWNENNLPTCKKRCPPFYSTATTTLTCKDINNEAVPCDKAVNGTYLTYNCNDYHEIPPGGSNILYCDDGVWDFQKPICQPICGKKVKVGEATALLWGGRQANDYEFPWVIAVFKISGTGFENICGGTLISRKVVITAAHCVTDTYGNALDQNKFQVAAGKVYNAFGDKRDVHAQYRKISKVIVNDGYRGETQKYIADVALLITQELFKLDPIVQPICMDNMNSVHLTNYQIGEVAGWGLTEEEEPSEILKAIKIPYKDSATCAKELPPSWEEVYNIFDKICAGRQNENIAVCKGDSGSGLVFKNREDNRYYLQGIVSIAPTLQNSQCNYQTNALYTSVQFYYSFITREMSKYFIEDCILPAYPKNGKWFLEGGVEKKPGDIVLSSTILRFSCNTRYILSTISAYNDCQSYYSHPTCLRICPKPLLPSGTQMLCKNSKNQYIDCTDIADGSSITFTCPNGFVSDRGTSTSTRFCRNGVYGNSAPSCIDIKQKPVHVSNTSDKSKKTTKHTTATTATTTSMITTPNPSITLEKSVTSQIINDGKKVICYYSGWTAYNGSYPEEVEPRLCTHIVYEYIGIHQNGELDLEGKGPDLHKLTMDLKNKNKDLKVMISVGGSRISYTLLRTLFTDSERKESFLYSTVEMIQAYSFDGLDFSWMFPQPSDKDIYISLLDQIKRIFKHYGWLLSVTVYPKLEDTGYDPLKMDSIVDWVTIKTLDVYNTLFFKVKDIQLYTGYDWKKEDLNLNRETVIRNWLDAGLSKNKLIMGIELYPIKFTYMNANNTKEKPKVVIHGYDEKRCPDYRLLQINWAIKRDNNTENDYVYGHHLNVWVGWNDADYIFSKGRYAKDKRLGGLAVFNIEQDDYKGVCGAKLVLLKGLLNGFGFSDSSFIRKKTYLNKFIGT